MDDRKFSVYATNEYHAFFFLYWHFTCYGISIGQVSSPFRLPYKQLFLHQNPFKLTRHNFILSIDRETGTAEPKLLCPEHFLVLGKLYKVLWRWQWHQDFFQKSSSSLWLPATVHCAYFTFTVLSMHLLSVFWLVSLSIVLDLTSSLIVFRYTLIYNPGIGIMTKKKVKLNWNAK